MNPFLEEDWQTVHHALLGIIWTEIGGQLPQGLLARQEQRLVIDEYDPPHGYVADVRITESWKQGIAPSWTPEQDRVGTIAIAEPEIFHVDKEVERWIEIRTQEGKVVTVIELLSPANKGSGSTTYRMKQRDYLESTTSLVEIDLLRGGTFVLPVPLEHVQRRIQKHGTYYHICVNRAWRAGFRELYAWPLRDRIPAFRIPLRETDKDIALDLQPLLDRCYEVGRYYTGRFDELPQPPFPPDEAEWVIERLRAAGLRE